MTVVGELNSLGLRTGRVEKLPVTFSRVEVKT